MLQFDNFLTANEIQLIKDTASPKLERSTGGMERAVSNYRTSKTAWLMPGELERDTLNVIQRIERRIARATGWSAKNQEHFQVLHYDKGQFYKEHHDYIIEHADMPCGPRVATFFIYLNDVEEGGGTHFPRVDLVAKPKTGRAIFWLNTDDELNQLDITHHAALPPESGEKWGANKWIHAYNFVDNWAKGLTG